MKTCVGFCFLILFSWLPAAGQERSVRPFDEGPKDASFTAFRSKVLKAVAAKDAKFIRSILDAKVQVDFGGGSGIKDFLAAWKNLSPSSEFWAEFGWAVSHGGKFGSQEGEKQFWAPYTFSGWPDDLDSYDYAVITGDRVRLRASPGVDAAIKSYLDFTIIKPHYLDDRKSDWVEVETLGGKRGFVAAEFVRSPIAYRAAFSKIRGHWLLTSFVAGD